MWLPGKVSATLQAFERTGESCVKSDARMFDEAEQPIYGTIFAYRRCGPGVLKNFYKTTYLGCCMAFRAEANPCGEIDVRLWEAPHDPHHGRTRCTSLFHCLAFRDTAGRSYDVS